jgi:hypothetical protein
MGTAARQDKNIRLLFALQVIIALGFAFVDDFPSLLKPLLERLLDVWLFALYVALTFLFAGKWWLLKHRP